MTDERQVGQQGSDGMATEAAAVIHRQWPEQPRVAVVLGTGLGGLASHVDQDVAVPYSELPGFPQPTALAHKGQVVCGRLEGVPVVALQGRVHYYEGHDVDTLTLPVRTAAALGCETLIVSNASGGLNPQFVAGDIMAIDSHIDLMGVLNVRSCSSVERQPFLRPSRRANYDTGLIEAAQSIGRSNDLDCHRGVYVGVTGPSYETRAEYRMMRAIGGDAVGMSTVPETIAAVTSGMRVLGLSTITNVARPDAPTVTTAQEVVDVARRAEAKLLTIVTGIVAMH